MTKIFVQIEVPDGKKCSFLCSYYANSDVGDGYICKLFNRFVIDKKKLPKCLSAPKVVEE